MNDLIDDPAPGQNTPEYSVSEISGAVKRTLEGSFGRIRVKGEVGRVFKARSGHLYYDLKDDNNVLACTTWKGQAARLSVAPEEGLEVVVTGRLTSFGAQSKYNLNVDEVTVAGAGALMAMLEKRRKALEAEGLFAPERKRKLPFLPEVIGVVTSPSGAVIRDILHRLRDRFPRKVLIWPVAVQGANCAPEVARAIKGFNELTPGGALPRPDLLIVARGGGSLEDLWGFNEENVVRAAAESVIPLISAVGHETDTTLIDHASDRRAPTPTAAAEMAVPVRLELLSWLETMAGRLSRGATQAVGQRRQRLDDLGRGLPRPEGLLEAPRQRLDRAAEKLAPALMGRVQNRRLDLQELSSGLTPALKLGVAARRAKLDRIAAGLSARRLGTGVAARREALEKLSARLEARTPDARLNEARTRFDEALQRLVRSGRQDLRRRSQQLEALERMRQTLGYQETLRRGYAVVRGDGALVTTAEAAANANALEIEFADGRLPVGPGGTPAPQQDKPEPKARPKGNPPEQGSLF